MVWLCLCLIAVGLALSLPGTWLARSAGRRLNAMDSAGVAGQVKAPRRRVPNIGGIAVFWAFALPVLAGLVAAMLLPARTLEGLHPALGEHLPGLRSAAPAGLAMLASALALHLMGLYDDRRPMGPSLKLGLMLGVSAFAVLATDTRLFTLLDGPAGGPWLSAAVTVVWIAAMVNAMNFIDNMDGLSGGVGAIASAAFLTVALIHGQWFVGACFALLLGSLLGFLWFNRPPATIFMGDGGSVVLGFLLAFLSVRITYLPAPPGEPGPWHAVLTPLLVLAIPIYDFVSVTAIRLSQGRSPFVGDLQHFSHRLVERGLTRPQAVVVIWGATAVTAVGGLALPSLAPWQAALVVAQTLVMLGVIAMFEKWARPAAR